MSLLLALLMALTTWHAPLPVHHTVPRGCHMPVRVAPARCRIMSPMVVSR